MLNPDAQKMNGESETAILIVDDMPDNLRVLAHILKNSGYTIRLLREGRSVMPSVLKAVPDLILLDILMPDLDGYAVCEQLKADPRTCDIPVLFLSALNEPADKIKAFAAGGVDYIAKPFHAEEVRARVHSHLAHHQLRRQLARQNDRLQQEMAERQRAEDALRESQGRLQESYQREQQRRQLSDTLREVAATVGSSLDTTSVLDAMLTQLRQVVTYHHATVTLVEDDQCTVVAGRDEHDDAVGRFTFPLTHYPLNVEALQAQRPILVSDVHHDVRWRPGMSDVTLRSFINAPLLVQDRPIGVLGVGRTDATPYTDDEASTVFAFASQAAVALENARLYARSQQELADRQRAEAALRKSFQLQQKIFTSLDDVILVADPETHTVLLCNPAVERMFGYPEQEIFGESVACLHESLDMFHLIVEDMRHALDAKEIFQAELRMRRKDGSLVLSSQHAAELTDECGERFGILWIIREITEQRRTENALADERNLLRTLINNIPMLIYVKDVDSRFLLANDATVASMDMTAPEEVIGRTDFDFHPIELAVQYAADERALLESGQPLVDHEEPVFDPRTGTIRWLLSTKVPFYDSQGRLAGLVGMNHDITARKAMEAQLLALNTELQDKNAQLAELNASKDKFFSIISHDLRGPFSMLMGHAQLLAANVDRYSHSELKTQLEKLHASADKLYALLENLLTWSRLQRGAMPYAPELFALRDIVEDTRDLFASKADQKQIALQGDIPAVIQVYADYQMVNTVLRNLVSNALKFTPTGGRISISATVRDARVHVAVTDTGVGIAADDLAKLFRLDAQYTHVGTDGETGTGLGLSLCKDLVEKNGGQIWVDCSQAQGVTFRFTLPRIAEDVAARAERTTSDR